MTDKGTTLWAPSRKASTSGSVVTSLGVSPRNTPGHAKPSESGSRGVTANARGARAPVTVHYNKGADARLVIKVRPDRVTDAIRRINAKLRESQ